MAKVICAGEESTCRECIAWRNRAAKYYVQPFPWEVALSMAVILVILTWSAAAVLKSSFFFVIILLASAIASVLFLWYLFRNNILGRCVWVFEGRGGLHVHTENPLERLDPAVFVGGFRNWSEYLYQYSVLQIRIGGWFRKNQIHGGSFGSWYIAHSWDGSIIRFRDEKHNELCWRIDSGFILSDMLVLMNGLYDLSYIQTRFRVLQSEQEYFAKVLFRTLALANDRARGRSQHAKLIRELIERELLHSRTSEDLLRKWKAEVAAEPSEKSEPSAAAISS